MRTEETDKYRAVIELFELGRVSGFENIFRLVKPSVVAKDLGVNYDTFRKKVDNPGKFTMKDMCEMSKLMGVDEAQFVSFIRQLYHRSNTFKNSP
jgi:hypothetical protein